MEIYAVGIGPGKVEYMTLNAMKIIKDSEVIVGFNTYIKLIEDLISDKEIIATGMTKEVVRCNAAIEQALKGKKVCVISSGDSGIYGMASLLYELAKPYENIEIKVEVGVTASTATAAILGSPITNDYATISLSDCLTPWDIIMKRLELLAQTDMAICIYNPQSRNRPDYLKRAVKALLKYRSGDIWCGYVKNALRDNTSSSVCRLDDLLEIDVDMFTTVIIGNSQTVLIDNKLVTPRGYKL
ncbi:MAG: precorrin-3B C(17)-methyltransferase [Bacilli bacterium]